MQTFQIQCSDSWMFPKFCAYPFHIFIPSVAPWLFAAMNVLSLSIKNTGLHSKFRVSGSDSCGISGQLPEKKKKSTWPSKTKAANGLFLHYKGDRSISKSGFCVLRGLSFLPLFVRVCCLFGPSWKKKNDKSEFRDCTPKVKMSKHCVFLHNIRNMINGMWSNITTCVGSRIK